jgi:6-phosphogluconolactonase/glucosamine-6-phosphate isomerase/deaminase
MFTNGPCSSAIVDMDPKNVHILNGNNPDLIGECKAYEQLIHDMGGIELFLAGIGEDGHIAFNEPGTFNYFQAFWVQQIIDSPP